MTHSDPVDASDWAVADVEPSGDDPKEWLVDPSDGTRWLFKPAVVTADRRQGEDWAELLTSRVAGLLGVPAAVIRLAVRAGKPGCLSKDARPLVLSSDGEELAPAHPGSVLLSELVEDYAPRSRDRRGHTLVNVQSVLRDVRPPRAIGDTPLTAFDVFAGYLVLDALVAGQDRHSDNWSVAFDPDGHSELVPSYDHASSLGFNLRDDLRGRLLADAEGLERWVSRGRATRFGDGQGVTLVEHAATALSMSAPALPHWLPRLESFDVPTWRAVGVPHAVLSDVGRMFAVEIVIANRRRLLDVIGTSPGHPPA